MGRRALYSSQIGTRRLGFAPEAAWEFKLLPQPYDSSTGFPSWDGIGRPPPRRRSLSPSQLALHPLRLAAVGLSSTDSEQATPSVRTPSTSPSVLLFTRLISI